MSCHRVWLEFFDIRAYVYLFCSEKIDIFSDYTSFRL